MRFNRKSIEVTLSTDIRAVLLAEMKEFLRVTGTADDEMIRSYISTATEAVKQYTRRAILTETFVMRADGFSSYDGDDRLAALGAGVHTVSVPHILGGGSSMDLPFPPLQSVTSVVTYDRDNTSSTFSASKYTVDLQSGRITLNEGETWPTNLRATNAVEITYVAGYGSGNVPSPILEAIREYVTQMYDGCAGSTDLFHSLLAPYRLADQLAW